MSVNFKLFYFSVANIYVQNYILHKHLSDITVITHLSISFNSETNSINLRDTRSNSLISDLTFENIQCLVINFNPQAYQQISTSTCFTQIFMTKNVVEKLFDKIYSLIKDTNMSLKNFSDQLELYITEPNNKENVLYKIFDQHIKQAMFDDSVFKNIIFGVIAYIIFKENILCHTYKIDEFKKNFSL